MLRGIGAVMDRWYAQDSAAGALPTLFAATAEIPGGSYVGPNGRGESRWTPALVGRSASASDMDLAAKVWRVSEEQTQVSWLL